MNSYQWIDSQRPLAVWYTGYVEAGMEFHASIIGRVLCGAWVGDESCVVVERHMKAVMQTEGFGIEEMT